MHERPDCRITLEVRDPPVFSANNQFTDNFTSA